MDNTQTTGSIKPMDYIPPKKWDDLNDSERVERMRDIVKSLTSSLSRSQVEIYNLRRKLKAHQHDENGKAFELRELQEYDNETSGINGIVGASLNAEGYF